LDEVVAPIQVVEVFKERFVEEYEVFTHLEGLAPHLFEYDFVDPFVVDVIWLISVPSQVANPGFQPLGVH
jgi:hypothetical protein